MTDSARAPDPAGRLRADCEAAYAAFLPPQLLALMGQADIGAARVGQHAERSLSVLFSDIRGFTTLSEGMNQQENFRLLNSYLAGVNPVISGAGGFIAKFIGDGIMALFPGSADDALQAGIDLLHHLRRYNAQAAAAGRVPIGIGVGINTGITMLGHVGSPERMETTVIGDTVNLASRLETETRTYDVPLLISEHTLYHLADAGRYHVRLIDRVRVKGKVHPQSLYEVFDADEPALLAGKQAALPMFERAVACYHQREMARAEEGFQACLRLAPGDTVTRLYLDRCAHFRAGGVHQGTGEIDLIPEWQAAFSIGVPVIDDQHRELLDRMRRLSDSVRKGADPAIHQVLAFLESYVVEHFHDEERLMQESGYPFIRQHQHEHETFGRYFSRLKAEILAAESDTSYLTFRIQLLLVDWLINHTTKTDRHFGLYLRDTRVDALAPGFVP